MQTASIRLSEPTTNGVLSFILNDVDQKRLTHKSRIKKYRKSSGEYVSLADQLEEENYNMHYLNNMRRVR